MAIVISDFEKALVKAVNEAHITESGYAGSFDFVLTVGNMGDILDCIEMVFSNRTPYRTFSTDVGEVSLINSTIDQDYSHADEATMLFQIESSKDVFDYVQYKTSYNSWVGLNWYYSKGKLVKPVPRITMVWEPVED